MSTQVCPGPRVSALPRAAPAGHERPAPSKPGACNRLACHLAATGCPSTAAASGPRSHPAPWTETSLASPLRPGAESGVWEGRPRVRPGESLVQAQPPSSTQKERATEALMPLKPRRHPYGEPGQRGSCKACCPLANSLQVLGRALWKTSPARSRGQEGRAGGALALSAHPDLPLVPPCSGPCPEEVRGAQGCPLRPRAPRRVSCLLLTTAQGHPVQGAGPRRSIPRPQSGEGPGQAGCPVPPSLGRKPVPSATARSGL